MKECPWLDFLANAIPALSFAAGRNPLPDTTAWGGTNVNLMSHGSGEYPLGWPREGQVWQHSDLKEVAYGFLYSLFDCVVLQGELK